MRPLNILFGLISSFTVFGQGFKPDTTVNQINLESRKSIIKKLKGDTSLIEKYFHHIQEGDVSHLDLRTANQKLILHFHPGNWTWAFSEFEVKFLDKKEDQTRMIKLADNEFVTESGIKLGTTKNDLIKKKGKPTTIKRNKEFEIIEYLTDDPNAKIVESYGQAEYFATYKLKDNRIVEFHFGFVMP